jgi:hypothetical protein
MSSFAQPPRPVRLPGPDHGRVQPVLKHSSKAVSFKSGGKTNPLEPIELKSRLSKRMCQILRNRSHWTHPACFQRATAKSRPISGNSVPSRTRIRGRASSGSTVPQNDPRMSFRFREQGDAGAPTHQDSAAATSDSGRPRSGSALLCGTPRRAPTGSRRQQSRNVALFQRDGRRGLSHARGFAPCPGKQIPMAGWKMGVDNGIRKLQA